LCGKKRDDLLFLKKKSISFLFSLGFEKKLSSKKKMSATQKEVFQEYPSLTTKDGKSGMRFIANAEQLEKEDNIWQVTEKIHGKNFQIFCNGEKTIPGSRTRPLEEKDYHEFNPGAEEKIMELLTKTRILYDYLKKTDEFSNIKELRMYGEIFGGFLPTSTGIKPKHVCKSQAVQKEILYSPQIEFGLFHIKVDEVFLSKDRTIYLGQMRNLFVIPILFSGTLKDCLDFSQKNLFLDSTIPSLLGYKNLHCTKNVREGHVIQPMNPRYDRRDWVCIKHKNEEFKESYLGEKKEAKHYQPKQTKSNKQMYSKEEMEEAVSMITLPRLKNVISHDVRPSGWKKLIGPLAQDILNDYAKENAPTKCKDCIDLPECDHEVTPLNRILIASDDPLFRKNLNLEIMNRLPTMYNSIFETNNSEDIEKVVMEDQS
jgi:Rnl2 family RNA ligase